MTPPCLPTTESLYPLYCYVCGARQAQRQATKWQALNRRWSTSNAGTYQKFARCTITSGRFGRIGDLNMHVTEHSIICFHGPPSLQCHTNRHLHRTRPALKGLSGQKKPVQEWTAGKGRAGHVCDHLVIEMKNKGYKPGPASSFFGALCASQVGPGIGPNIGGSFGGGFSAENFRAPWDLCASQVGLGIKPDIGGSFGGGFSAENFRAPWDQPKKILTALWHPLRQQNVSEKNKSGGKSVC